jgi:hypothetical protein
MKRIFMSLLLSIGMPLLLSAQNQKGEEVPRHKPDEAKQLVGQQVVIAGRIAEVSKATKLVRLNFEKPFPDQPFQAVIFSSATNRFKGIDFDTLKDKTVEVTGKVTEYHGRPQIVVEAPGNLKVVAGGERSKQ